MKKYDVIVCGGGPAGVCSALRASREGVSVLLIEKNGCLGGIWTAGMVGLFLDTAGKGGIIREICERLENSDSGRFIRGGNFLCSPEDLKYLLETMCRESGVDIRLYTWITGCRKHGNKILSVCTHSKSGKEEFQGKIFVDATGDGDVGYFAGCQYEIGLHEGTVRQPMSLFALVSGLRYEDVKSFDNAVEPPSGESPKRLLNKALEEIGILPSQTLPALYHLSNDLYLFTVTHEYGYQSENANDLTAATLHARTEIHQIAKTLRKQGGIWRNIRVAATAETIGARDGRRILGVETVTREDILNSKRFDDAVCTAYFPMDVHAVSSEETSGYSYVGKTSGYGIPAGALIAKDMENLLMAGKCISGDFYAQASYRVTGIAAATGEQAGAMASACLKHSFHSVKEVLQLLK